jgi:hypothetical protein
MVHLLSRSYRMGIVLTAFGALTACAINNEPQAAPNPGGQSWVENDIGITTVDVQKKPRGIPAEAELTFFGRPGNTYAVRREPISEEGILYVYDDTAHHLLCAQVLSPQKPFAKFPICDDSHEFRGFFLPARLIATTQP